MTSGNRTLFTLSYVILDVGAKTECEEVELRREPTPYILCLL